MIRINMSSCVSAATIATTTMRVYKIINCSVISYNKRTYGKLQVRSIILSPYNVFLSIPYHLIYLHFSVHFSHRAKSHLCKTVRSHPPSHSLQQCLCRCGSEWECGGGSVAFGRFIAVAFSFISFHETSAAMWIDYPSILYATLWVCLCVCECV